MAALPSLGTIVKQLDQLNEFERQPVAAEKLHGGGYFAAVFSGEHVAATEFVIGALFVQFGAGVLDVLVGLLIGNLLAVLSWALVCAPIAVQTRLTLYWYLRQIGGPVVMIVYNVLNALLYCILAGAMITVSASAIRIPFGITAETAWYPRHFSFVLLVLVVGAVVVTLAILGFTRLAQFSSVCAPWMILMFVAGALAALPALAPVGGLGDFWRVASERIWAGAPPGYQSLRVEGERIVLSFDHVGEGLCAAGGGRLRGFSIAALPEEQGRASRPQFVEAVAQIVGDHVVVHSPLVKDPAVVRYQWPEEPEGILCNSNRLAIRPFSTDMVSAPTKLGFWHIVAFAWVCNLAMHLGLSDMALFRYARRASYGFYSAFGMYLGHYLSWICAGIMGAAAGVLLDLPLQTLDAGAVAHAALGAVGALTVVIAGWTTANPTLYRAGLALQAVTPGWPRWLVTLAVGAVTTVVACFPFVFTGLLDFVGYYGLLLMPVGAIVVMEHWVFPRIGWTQYWVTRKGLPLNWPALVAWGVALLAGLVLYLTGALHLFFLAAPVWVLTAALYIALSAIAGARQRLPELPAEPTTAPASATPVGPSKPVPPRPADRRPWEEKLYYVAGIGALMCLCFCLLLPLFVFVAGRGGPPVHAANMQTLNQFLVWITLGYFVCGTAWLNLRQRRKE